MLIIYLLIALDVLSFVTNLAIQTKHVLLLGGSFFAIGLLGSLSSLLSVVWRPIALGP
ncbi:unnamed protein product [Acanthoscelides obtectus]|uniref:Uncharacterized protein n=1 Tax=Acanthoscelides obtectus TaxID=200917 RepID=A0A9P0L2S3_ACAOB|nr:unnamed protein product [Acanthoscelides obtectus]CAK1643459.1 hypothetical protein AOBTE_LOCUS13535 [Acanthoscelides obtectus]